MKSLNLVIWTICLLGCSKKTPPVYDTIVAEGFLIEESTNNKFNPFAEAFVHLYDKTSIQPQGLVPIASAKVDENGYYKLITKHALNEDGNLGLEASAGPNYGGTGITNNIVFANSIKMDFIIICSSILRRTFVNQSNSTYDSIIMHVSNTKGLSTEKYLVSGSRTILNTFKLQGQEENFIITKIYSDTTYKQRFDTIRTSCLTIVQDSIFY